MSRTTNPRRISQVAHQKLARIAGTRAVAALFATQASRVERLFFTKDFQTEAADYCRLLARRRKPFRMVGPDELARIAGTVLHGGVVALVHARPVGQFEPDNAREWARDGELLLLLDGIGNPHNLGAIARTAAFFGLPRLVLSDHPAQAMPSDASHRVAEGGLEFLEVYGASRFAATLAELARFYLVVGASAEGGQPIEMLPQSDRPIALVLGNEEHGLPAATLKACDRLVTIDGAGSVQSLNVAASAAVLVHALVGRHSQAPGRRLRALGRRLRAPGRH